MIGLALLVLCTLQVVGGFLIDFLFSPDRKSIPWWDKMHWWMGRFTLIAAIVNIPIGLLLYSNMLGIVPITWSALYALAITISIIVAATFQFKFGQSHHPIDNDKA